MSKDKLTIKINGEDYKLKCTLGFWRKCGFKREEVQVIESDPDKYITTLKLALFYGNKTEKGWNSIQDMEKIFTEEILEEIEEDYTQNVVFATIHYLPENLRKIILKKMADVEDQVEGMVDSEIDNAMSPEPADQEDVKKN